MLVNWFVVVFAHVVVAVVMFWAGPRSQRYYSHYLYLTYGENLGRGRSREETSATVLIGSNQNNTGHRTCRMEIKKG